MVLKSIPKSKFFIFSAFPSIQHFFNGLVLFFPQQIDPSAHRGPVLKNFRSKNFLSKIIVSPLLMAHKLWGCYDSIFIFASYQPNSFPCYSRDTGTKLTHTFTWRSHLNIKPKHLQYLKIQNRNFRIQSISVSFSKWRSNAGLRFCFW